MPFWVTFFGRYEVNLLFLFDIFFPAWFYELNWTDMIFVDWEEVLTNWQEFDLKDAFKSNDFNILAYIADDLDTWLVGQPGGAEFARGPE